MNPAEIGEMVRNLIHAYKHGATDEGIGEAIVQIVEAAMDAVIEKQMASPDNNDDAFDYIMSPWARSLFGSGK